MNSLGKSNTLFLDTGNMLYYRYNEIKADTYEVQNDIIIKAMNMMQYDGINLGINDIYPDMAYLEERCNRVDFPIISANTEVFENCKSNPVQKYFIKDVNGIRIGVTGVIPPEEQDLSLDKMVKAFYIEEPEKALKAIIPDLAAKTDFIILLSGLKSEKTLELLGKIPEINVGMGVDGIPYQLPIKSSILPEHSDPSLMTITPRGIELGILEIEKDGEKVNVTDAKRVYLGKKIASDEKILELSSQVEEKRIALAAKKKVEELKRERIKHQELLKDLDLTPEEFFKKYNKPANNVEDKS